MQGRQDDFKFPQTVVEVFPEASLPDGQLKVLVGCRHYPYVGVFLPVAAYRDIAAFLQGTQEHALYLHGQCSYFVKEQGPATGRFKEAFTVCVRPRKRPLHMPEKERGRKLFGNDPAVYCQERLFPALAGIMDTLRYGFLAGTVRTKNQTEMSNGATVRARFSTSFICRLFLGRMPLSFPYMTERGCRMFFIRLCSSSI